MSLVAELSEEARLLPNTDAMLPAATVRVTVAALITPPAKIAGGGLVMTLDCSVTVPLRAVSLPSKVAPAFIVMDWSAKMLPLKTELAPRFAEVPTCQKTL